MNDFKLVEDKSFSKLVNTSSNKNTLNEIFSFKESFSPFLLQEITKRYGLQSTKKMYEPFLGTGSIFLDKTSQECFGHDTNPLAIKISQAKIDIIDKTEIERFSKKFDIKKVKTKQHNLPEWNSYSRYVEKEKYDFILSLFDYFETLTNDKKMLNFLRMTIIANLDIIFDYKRDGNGIKYRKSKIAFEDLPKYVENLICRAIQLKLEYQQNNPTKTLNAKVQTSTLYDKEIKGVDLIVTSPPYCNMFDYFEVYKMELWTSGIVKSSSDMQALKKTALRSNYNAKINEDKIESTILEECLSKLDGAEKRKINMINNYFYDMNEVLKNCWKYLKKNAYFCIVVGNSFYQNKPIKTDLILAELAEKAGFEVVEIIKSRTLTTSSQQRTKIADSDKKFLRESIVVLRRC